MTARSRWPPVPDVNGNEFMRQPRARTRKPFLRNFLQSRQVGSKKKRLVFRMRPKPALQSALGVKSRPHSVRGMTTAQARIAPFMYCIGTRRIRRSYQRGSQLRGAGVGSAQAPGSGTMSFHWSKLIDPTKRVGVASISLRISCVTIHAENGTPCSSS